MTLAKDTKIVLWFVGITAFVSTCSIGISIGYQMGRRVQGYPGPRAPSGNSVEKTVDRAIEAEDLTQVDLVELEPQARSMAQEVLPEAKLVQIRADDFTGGVVDVTHDTSVVFYFAKRIVDATKPPGKDVHFESVEVTIVGEKLRARKLDGPEEASHAMHLAQSKGSPAPSCGSKRLWKRVVKSGVPSNAVAILSFGAIEPMTWTVYIPEHSEWRRQVDGETCEVL